MSRSTLVSKPVRLEDLSFDELYADISGNWKTKAARLQNRRWRLLSARSFQNHHKRPNRGKHIIVENFR